MKGKSYMHFSRKIHMRYTQIDNTFHVCDYLGASGLQATCHTRVENQHPYSQQKSVLKANLGVLLA